MKLFSLVVVAVICTASHAQVFETIDVSSPFSVTSADTVSLKLDETKYIRNLIIKAEGVGQASTVEVMVNGEVKGTLYAPGHDPSYVVTVAEPASSIEFRHREGGTMKVLDVKATVSSWSAGEDGNEGGIGGSVDQVEKLAFKVISIIEGIQPFSTLNEETTYLMPIKKLAGRVHVMSAAHGNLSYKTRRALVALQYQIQFSEPYIDMILEKNALFDMGVELLTVKETIRELLD